MHWPSCRSRYRNGHECDGYDPVMTAEEMGKLNKKWTSDIWGQTDFITIHAVNEVLKILSMMTPSPYVRTASV